MEFKVFFLCFAVLIAVTSAATVCKCEDKKNTVSKYNVKIKDEELELEFEEKVEIDTEKQTETMTIPKIQTGKNGNEGEVKVVFDFNLNMTMHRVSVAEACFLSQSTENELKPNELLKILEQSLHRQVTSGSTAMNQTDMDYEAVSTITDRSILSDEMALMCAKLPIYLIKRRTTTRIQVSVFTQFPTFLPACHNSKIKRWLKQFFHLNLKDTAFPRIIAGGDYLYFRTKRGRLFEEDDYFKYFSQEVVP